MSMDMDVDPYPLVTDSIQKQSVAEASLMPGLPCCSPSLSQSANTALPSTEFLVSRNGNSKSILGGYNKHFGVYPWYKGATTYQDIASISKILQGIRTMGATGFCVMTVDLPGVDDILKATHVINGKEVAISRTIFVGGLPKTIDEGELEMFFSKFGKVVEHQIVRFPNSEESAGFGFVIYSSDKEALDLAAKGSLDFAGVSVVIKQAIFMKCISRSTLSEFEDLIG